MSHRVIAQPLAIKFRTGTLDEILQAAASEDKAVLLFYTMAGCGVCERMEQEMFGNPMVAEYVNATFVSRRVDGNLPADRSIGEQYGVAFNTTVQFISADGKFMHEVAGWFSPTAFLEQCSRAFDTTRSLSAIQARYNAGHRDADLLYEYISARRNAYRWDSLSVEAYFAAISDTALHQPRNLEFIYDNILYRETVTSWPGEREFEYLVKNKALFDQYFDPGQVLARIVFIGYRDAFKAINAHDSARFFRIRDVLARYELPQKLSVVSQRGEVEGWLEAYDFVSNIEWSWYEEMGDTAMAHYHENIYVEEMWDSSYALYNLALGYYSDFDDRPRLLRAKRMIERSIELQRNYTNTDVYAAILFKLEEYEAALEEIDKALDMAEGDGNRGSSQALKNDILHALEND